MPRGCRATNSLAAVLAAARRLGDRSVADMLLEVSNARMTVPSRRGMLTALVLATMPHWFLLARQAITGIGARVVGSGHLAGIVSLETDAYRDEQVGEVACLYTVSQFSGKGAGGLLVDGLVERAAALGLRAVFAVTVSEAAAEFFARKGFTEVAHDVLPAAKWRSYDAARRASARAFWCAV